MISQSVSVSTIPTTIPLSSHTAVAGVACDSLTEGWLSSRTSFAIDHLAIEPGCQKVKAKVVLWNRGSDFPAGSNGWPHTAPARLERAVLGPPAASTCDLIALPPIAIAAIAATPTMLVPACFAARRRRT